MYFKFIFLKLRKTSNIILRKNLKLRKDRSIRQFGLLCRYLFYRHQYTLLNFAFFREIHKSNIFGIIYLYISILYLTLEHLTMVYFDSI